MIRISACLSENEIGGSNKNNNVLSPEGTVPSVIGYMVAANLRPSHSHFFCIITLPFFSAGLMQT